MKTTEERFLEVARERAGGHFAIFGFTTNFKAAFSTPRLMASTREAYYEVGALSGHPTLEAAMQAAIDDPEGHHFGSGSLKEKGRQLQFDVEVRVPDHMRQ